MFEIKHRFTGLVLRTVDAADLSMANLSDANLSDANLSMADLSMANLSMADLRGANVSDANLSDANLSMADLSEANLSMADLRGANLSDANLSMADLSEADLSLADLRGANLSDANLRGADLSEADLSLADLSESTIMPSGETWREYLSEVVPALLTAGGKPLDLVACKEHWDCHSWDNCPMAAAFGVSSAGSVPLLMRPRVREFIQFFDAGLIPMPGAAIAKAEACRESP